jgi:hypothetical protein
MCRRLQPHFLYEFGDCPQAQFSRSPLNRHVFRARRYTASFSLSSAATVQAMATAPGYSVSAVATAAFKFRTPAATYPITVTVTATPTGSSKTLQLNPIQLTLIVN